MTCRADTSRIKFMIVITLQMICIHYSTLLNFYWCSDKQMLFCILYRLKWFRGSKFKSQASLNVFNEKHSAESFYYYLHFITNKKRHFGGWDFTLQWIYSNRHLTFEMVHLYLIIAKRSTSHLIHSRVHLMFISESYILSNNTYSSIKLEKK